MKTTELKELFANAKNAQDLIAIFEANPGLEDEILKLGKKQGINLDEPRELTDLELELVAGGLNLKKGVILTMSTLLLAGTLTVPLSQATKAHAVEPKKGGKPTIEQVDSKNNQKLVEDEILETLGGPSPDITITGGDSIAHGPGKIDDNKNKEQGESANQDYLAKAMKHAENTFFNFVKAGLGEVCNNIIGKTFGGALKDSMLAIFNTKGSDDIKIADLTKEVLEGISKSTEKIIDNSNTNTFKITSTITDESKIIQQKIDAVNAGKTVQNFSTELDTIIRTFNVNSDVKNHIHALSNKDQVKAGEYYHDWYGTINDSFSSVYTTNTKNEKRALVRNFEDVSRALSAKDTANNSVAVCNGKPVNIFEINKLAVHANAKYTFLNQSINEREKFLKENLKKYIAAYTTISHLVKHEKNRVHLLITQEMINLMAKNPSATQQLQDYLNSGQLHKYIDSKGLVSEEGNTAFNKFLKNYNLYLREGINHDGGKEKGAWAQYGTQYSRAIDDWNSLQKSFENGIKAFQQEAETINYIKSNMNIYYNGSVAYKPVRCGRMVDYKLNNGKKLSEGTKIMITDEEYRSIKDDFLINAHINNKNRRYGQLTDKERYERGKNKYKNWERNVKNFLKNNNDPNFPKQVNYNLTNSEISKLVDLHKNYCIANKCRPEEIIDYIYMGSDDFKFENFPNFHREIYIYNWLGHIFTEGKDHTQGLGISKNFKYLDRHDSKVLKNVKVTYEISFRHYNNFMYERADYNLGKLEDVTKQYEAGLKAIADKYKKKQE